MLLSEIIQQIVVLFNDNSPFQTSGVRIGTAPMTTRGYKEEDFIKVAHRIDEVVKELDAEKAAEAQA